MCRLPPLDIEIGLIERIYDTTLDPALWPGVMQQVAAIMGGNYAVILFFDPRAGRLTHDISNDIPARETYLHHFSSIDPRNTFGVTAPAGLTFTDAAFIDGAGIGRSEFYQDYMLPNEMGHVGAHMLQNDADGISGIAVQRPFRMAPFEPTELRLLKRLAPHLRRARRLQVRLGTMAGLAPGWALGLLQGLPWGIIVLNGSLRPVFVNGAAEGILAKADGTRLDGQGLHAAHPWDDHRLRKTLAQALAGTGGELRVRRPSGEPDWIVSVAPTRSPADRVRAVVHVVVHLLDPSSRPTCPPKRLQALFDLSPAEARVAVGLLSGLSAIEIATRHGVAISTVRTQLECLYAKTATAGWGELLSLLQNVSALSDELAALPSSRR